MKTIKLRTMALVVALGALCAQPVFAVHTTTSTVYPTQIVQTSPYWGELLNSTVSQYMYSDPFMDMLMAKTGDFGMFGTVAKAVAPIVLGNGPMMLKMAYDVISTGYGFLQQYAAVSNESFISRAVRIAALGGLWFYREQIQQQPVVKAMLAAVAIVKALNTVSSFKVA